MPSSLSSVDAVLASLTAHRYVADRALATSIYLSLCLGKPLLLEGEAGVGKTQVAKTVASMLGGRLIRLQGYEGIDVSHAVYEWNYLRQIMAIRVAEASHETVGDVFSEEFLIRRPLLQALDGAADGPPTVLLLDELDRVDDEFEAYLLEILSDFQVSIPELGTIRAERHPVVIVTSNRTRELHDALKRRCLYHWIDYPTFDKEVEIVALQVPDAPARLREEAVCLVQRVREFELYKAPGVAETLDWVRALAVLGRESLDEDVVQATLGVILKNQEDVERVERHPVGRLVEGIGGGV